MLFLIRAPAYTLLCTPCDGLDDLQRGFPCLHQGLQDGVHAQPAAGHELAPFLG